MHIPITKQLTVIVFLKSIVVVLFVLASWYSVDRLYSYYAFTGNETLWIDGFSWRIFFSYFSAILLVCLPMIGIFLKQKIAWVLITSYFYFLLISVAYISLSDGGSDFLLLLKTIPLFILFFGCFIFLANRKGVYSYYDIPRSKLLRVNIIAFTVGMLLSIGNTARALL